MNKTTLTFITAVFVIIVVVTSATGYVILGRPGGMIPFLVASVIFAIVFNIVKDVLTKRSLRRISELITAHSIKPEAVYIRDGIMKLRHSFFIFTRDNFIVTYQNDNEIRSISYTDIAAISGPGLLGLTLIRLKSGEELCEKVNMTIANSEALDNIVNSREIPAGVALIASGYSGLGGRLVASKMAAKGYEKAQNFTDEFTKRNIKIMDNDHFIRQQNVRFWIIAVVASGFLLLSAALFALI